MRIRTTLREISGIHHVTAIAGDPQRNIDFYVGFLGLRLVKLTVNFDDPETYHLYYGDGVGRPGTIMTFFPWPNAPEGRRGTGQATTSSFAIPDGSIDFWSRRLKDRKIHYKGLQNGYGGQTLSFSDPDGLSIELVAHPRAVERDGWDGGFVPHEYAVRGFHAVTLTEEGYERTADLLTRELGFGPPRRDGDRFRFETKEGGPASTVDVRCQPASLPGVVSVGTVHHVAWRTPNDEQQKEWRAVLVRAGLNVTPVIDRSYFHSIYFREPGGVLFEIATDPPGFTVDESEADLGRNLKLPSWLESTRQHLVHTLPLVHLPEVTS